MAINVVNSTGDSLKFLKNQSSILLNSDTNDVTVNGVNVIVDKPKRGDVLCVKNGKVIWIDGLSINPEQLSSSIVGICMVVDGNKATVMYIEALSVWLPDDFLNKTYFNVTYLGSYVQTTSHFYLNSGFVMSDPWSMFTIDSYAYYGNTGITSCITYDSCNITMSNVNYNDAYNGTQESKVACYLAVSKDLFDTNPYCQILRDTYDSYDEYLYSKMIMYPCGKGGAITEQPSGKENTYRLAELGEDAAPVAYDVSKISVDAPNLGAGNWWIPSLAELLQIKYEFIGLSNISDDITCKVFNKINERDPFLYRCCTSTIIGGSYLFGCVDIDDTLLFHYMKDYNNQTNSYVYPITVYEF